MSLRFRVKAFHRGAWKRGKISEREAEVKSNQVLIFIIVPKLCNGDVEMKSIFSIALVVFTSKCNHSNAFITLFLCLKEFYNKLLFCNPTTGFLKTGGGRRQMSSKNWFINKFFKITRNYGKVLVNPAFLSLYRTVRSQTLLYNRSLLSYFHP